MKMAIVAYQAVTYVETLNGVYKVSYFYLSMGAAMVIYTFNDSPAWKAGESVAHLSPAAYQRAVTSR